MNTVLAIFIGGGVGSVFRHFCVLASKAMFGANFPYGTIFVNVVGSLLIGIIMQTAISKGNVTPNMQALLVTGFLGGFTTFSAFSLDVFGLSESGQTMAVIAYIVATVFLSLLGVFAGAYLMRGVLAG